MAKVNVSLEVRRVIFEVLEPDRTPSTVLLVPRQFSKPPITDPLPQN
jgi:hypothetical protein